MGCQRARERTRAATQPTSASAQAARLSSAGPQSVVGHRWPSAAGPDASLSLCGRCWQLDYAHGMGAARLGGGARSPGVAVAASAASAARRQCTSATLGCMLQVCCMCDCMCQKSLHAWISCVRMCVHSTYFRYLYSSHAHDIDRPTDARLRVPLHTHTSLPLRTAMSMCHPKPDPAWPKTQSPGGQIRPS